MQMDSKLPTSGLRPPACVRRGPQGGWSSPTRCRTYKRKDVRDEMSAHLPTCHPPGLVTQPRARAFLLVYIPTLRRATLTLPIQILISLTQYSDPVALKAHRRYQEMSFTKVLFSAIPALMSTIDENLQHT